MFVEFPTDPGCDTLDRQYMLGPSLLVAPVFSPDGWVDYYLPAGRWTNLLSGRVVEGGRWVREQHDFFSLPLLVRPNSVLPAGSIDNRPDYDYVDGVTFHVFELDDGATVQTVVPTATGRTALVLHTTRTGNQVTFRAEGDTRRWRVLLRNIPAVRSVEGAQARAEREGLVLLPEGDARKMVVQL
jgi:alpha-D-xyloside xylohydrolase